MITDRLEGEGAGIKSVTFEVNGENAYGLLQSEIGVHRLVRISPFDANARRHTSFASVFVYPQVDDEIKIDIKLDDLRIDTFRSSGAGGQHVNMTDSAVRITHFPTTAPSWCSARTSARSTRTATRAMKQLRARLYEFELDKKREETRKTEDSKLDINFGSQIRNYVLAPYRLVKDLRSRLSLGDVDRVLEGDLDPLIHAYLVWRKHRQDRRRRQGRAAGVSRRISCPRRRRRRADPRRASGGVPHRDRVRPGSQCAGRRGGGADLRGQGASAHEPSDRARGFGGDGAWIGLVVARGRGALGAALLARAAHPGGAQSAAHSGHCDRGPSHGRAADAGASAGAGTDSRGGSADCGAQRQPVHRAFPDRRRARARIAGGFRAGWRSGAGRDRIDRAVAGGRARCCCGRA